MPEALGAPLGPAIQFDGDALACLNSSEVLEWQSVPVGPGHHT